MKRPTMRSMLTSIKPGDLSGAYAHVRRPRRRRSRVRELQPQMAQAVRLLRAAGRLGVPGALPGPPELLPMGARVLAQSYLNRFSMPMLEGLAPAPVDARAVQPYLYHCSSHVAC